MNAPRFAVGDRIALSASYLRSGGRRIFRLDNGRRVSKLALQSLVERQARSDSRPAGACNAKLEAVMPASRSRPKTVTPACPELLPMMRLKTASGTIYTCDRSAMGTALLDLEAALTALTFEVDAIPEDTTIMRLSPFLSLMRNAQLACWQAFTGDDKKRRRAA